MSRFKQEDADALMVACHRRCCLCHRFCGVKMEIDHIIQSADDGAADIANGIAVCFECHAEIHSYNDEHPRGRKFHPEELRQHKEQWLKICASPVTFATVQPFETRIDLLQSLFDERELNIEVSKQRETVVSADASRILEAIRQLFSEQKREICREVIDDLRRVLDEQRDMDKGLTVSHSGEDIKYFNRISECRKSPASPKPTFRGPKIPNVQNAGNPLHRQSQPSEDRRYRMFPH
jgi:hypothetical protein